MRCRCLFLKVLSFDRSRPVSYTILSVKQERIVEELDDEVKIQILRGPRTGANSWPRPAPRPSCGTSQRLQCVMSACQSSIWPVAGITERSRATLLSRRGIGKASVLDTLSPPAPQLHKSYVDIPNVFSASSVFKYIQNYYWIIFCL